MNKPLVMTPGPTYVHEDVRRAMQQEVGNPDVEESFFEFYRETCERLKELLKTKNDVIILSGEGIWVWRLPVLQLLNRETEFCVLIMAYSETDLAIL